MRDADTAMYHAKRSGKGRHEVFDETMHTAAIETLQLETDLRRAVERGEISVDYQPIFSLVTEEVEAVEALARWNHPTMGRIPPKKFIALAEEIGMVDTLSAFVMNRACLHIKEIQDEIASAGKIGLNVNLSSKEFAKSTLVPTVTNILRETGVSPTSLKLEITESVLFEFQEKALNTLESLRDLGIDFSIDDFGTGYSNLGYLMQLPVSSLKIDGSFVQKIGKVGGDAELVRAVISLAQTLGMKVVAEGVETEEQLMELKKLRCDAAQGFLLAGPMNFETLKGFLRNRSEVPFVNMVLESASNPQFS
jgi:EAL domain-containing protein (putative c-di-GMP-specific phosphodiesterase class I)